MPSSPPDPAAALAALDDSAIAEAAASGLLAFNPDEQSVDIILVRYLQHSLALARGLSARDLLRCNANVETLFERLRETDADDLLEECIDEIVMVIVGPLEANGTPYEAAAEAAVRTTEEVINTAAAHLYRFVLKAGAQLQN